MCRKKKWTVEKLTDLAGKYARDCSDQKEFYTHKNVGCSERTYYQCMANPEYLQFQTIIKKEIIDISVPILVDLAKANVKRTLVEGLDPEATPDQRKRADTMAMFTLKTKDGWKETAEEISNLVEIIRVGGIEKDSN